MVDFSLERQPDVTDEMQDAAVRAYEKGCEEIKANRSVWGWPLACAIQAALEIQFLDEINQLRKDAEHHRWTIVEDGETLLICKRDHDKTEACSYVRYVPATESP